MNKSLIICLMLICTARSVLAAGADNWATPIPPPPSAEQRDKYGFKWLDFQTTFCEERLGSFAPINNQTAIGVPGTVPLPFGYVMRSRYSEFDMVFGMTTDKGEKRPYTLPSFWQSSPGGWYPGCINEWDYDGIHYKVSVISVPNDPEPVDLYEIVLKNTSAKSGQGSLFVNLETSTSAKADGNLISDRGKPLIVMDPAVPVQTVWRDAGCVDPRANASGPWDFAMSSDRWIRHRDGYYGQPIEYMLKAGAGESLQVFLGYGGVPNITTPNWDEPLEKMDPFIRELMEPKPRAVIATVEGDPTSQTLHLERRKHVIQKFVGRDTDGDGYIKVSVRATPESRQPACLSWIYAYDVNAKIAREDLFDDPSDMKGSSTEFLPGPGQPGLEPRVMGDANVGGAVTKYKIDVGGDFFDSPDAQRIRLGSDPTVFAMRLSYAPTLAPNEEKRYLLKLPAIDRPEPACYGNPGHPYDTKESWKVLLEARHPDNKAPYGEDVPVGINPADYAVNGPKSKDVWQKQLVAARSLTWDQGMRKVSTLWEGFLAKSAKFLTPEPVLGDLYKHQLATLELYRLQLYPYDYHLTVGGPWFYWDTSAARDIPYVMHAWELSGMNDIAKSYLKTWNTPRSKLPRSQWTIGQWDDKDPTRNGMWLTRTRQHDGQGQMIWAITDHYLLTGDKKWLAANYPALKAGTEWIIRARQGEKERLGDPQNPAYGLLPLGSGEAGGGGHSYYVNSFGVMGMRKAAIAAKALGKTEDAARFQKDADDYQAAITRSMQKSFVRFNDFAGSIPQNVEESARKEGEFTTVFTPVLIWPTEVLAPQDPLATAAWQYMAYRGSTRGAIMEWPYIYCDWGTSMIRRGEPDKACDLFYTYVNDASGTHDYSECLALYFKFPEFDPPKVGMLGGGEGPHNWAAGFYVVYMRNLMLHEEGNTLHIAPASPRKWLAQTKPFGVEDAPSYFGKVTYHLAADPDQTTVRGDVKLDSKRKPARLLIHVRGQGGKGLSSVTLNGKPWDAFQGDTIVVADPPASIEIEAKYRK